MKRFFVLMLLIAAVGCKNSGVEKPDNLIEMETMEAILYDLSLLQALRSTSKIELDSAGIDPKSYIFEKYKIDSLQFANSNTYYAASNLKKYEKMYDRINEKLQNNKKYMDSLAKLQSKPKETVLPETPQ